jgi:hypothetical protein
MRNRRIKVAFSQYDNESSDRGDHSAEGWINEKGVSMEPPPGATDAVDNAIFYLILNGALDMNGAFEFGNYYYTDYIPEYDGKGTCTQKQYFPEGFTKQEEKKIYELVNAQKLLRSGVKTWQEKQAS